MTDAVENDVLATEETPQLGPTIDLEPTAVAEAPTLVQTIEHAPQQQSVTAIQTCAVSGEDENLSSESKVIIVKQTNQKAWLKQVVESSRKLYALIN